jgi:hypothetical protein
MIYRQNIILTMGVVVTYVKVKEEKFFLKLKKEKK